MPKSAERLFVALDMPDPAAAGKMAELLGKTGAGFKIGLELFMNGGLALVAELALKYPLFLDLKYHDIPNTVAAAVKAAAGLGVKMINLHAAGGSKMMQAAKDTIGSGSDRPLLVAVTVLTSMNEEDLLETGIVSGAREQVSSLARLAARCGLDGVVCSPLEIGAVKEAVSDSFLTVTPGVRPVGEKSDDQSRIAAPADVIRAGGNYLVVGRPIIKAQDPLKAAEKIIAEMEGAL